MAKITKTKKAAPKKPVKKTAKKAKSKKKPSGCSMMEACPCATSQCSGFSKVKSLLGKVFCHGKGN